MENVALRNKIASVMVEHLGLNKDELLSDKSFADMGVDSLSLLELHMTLEDEFNISMDSHNEKQPLPKNLSELATAIAAHAPNLPEPA